MGGSNMPPALYTKGLRRPLSMQSRGSPPLLFLFQFLSSWCAELSTVLLLQVTVPNKPELALIVPTAAETVGGTVLGTASWAGTIEQKAKLRCLDRWSPGTLDGLRSSHMYLGSEVSLSVLWFYNKSPWNNSSRLFHSLVAWVRNQYWQCYRAVPRDLSRDLRAGIFGRLVDSQDTGYGLTPWVGLPITPSTWGLSLCPIKMEKEKDGGVEEGEGKKGVMKAMLCFLAWPWKLLPFGPAVFFWFKGKSRHGSQRRRGYESGGAHPWPQHWEAGQEDSGFKASLSYKVRPCFRTKPQPHKMERIKDSHSFP